MNISFVIPVYKEEDNILSLIEKINHNCNKSEINYKIFLIDDSPTQIIKNKTKTFDNNLIYIFRRKKIRKRFSCFIWPRGSLKNQIHNI